MTDPIRHIVLLALENRSFDQMLGSLSELGVTLDGVAPNNVNVGRNGTYHQELSFMRQMRLDPMHELAHVQRQLGGGNGGFIADFEDTYGDRVTDQDRHAVMGYYPPRFLPALHRLALDFTICDRWFSSVP